jgi:hypothetical protein
MLLSGMARIYTMPWCSYILAHLELESNARPTCIRRHTYHAGEKKKKRRRR